MKIGVQPSAATLLADAPSHTAQELAEYLLLLKGWTNTQPEGLDTASKFPKLSSGARVICNSRNTGIS
ncbi:MAG: hypothetical protein K2X27_26195 [Candidatus Obscuribacterales bacterium]|nr:hypothetical protein [Candidatus Obscuribacterales bacterium]